MLRNALRSWSDRPLQLLKTTLCLKCASTLPATHFKLTSQRRNIRRRQCAQSLRAYLTARLSIIDLRQAWGSILNSNFATSVCAWSSTSTQRTRVNRSQPTSSWRASRRDQLHLPTILERDEIGDSTVDIRSARDITITRVYFALNPIIMQL